MRWPRLTQFYRAYPELDSYSDSECVRLVWQAKVRRGDAIWILPAAAALLAFLAWMGVGSVMYMILFTVISPRNARPTAGGFLIPTLFVGVFIFAIVWTVVRRRLIIRSIRNIANRAGCPFCDFSLVGLKPEGSAVRCPECGNRVRLAEHGINPDDLVGDTPGALAQERGKLGAGPMSAYRPPPTKKKQGSRPS